MCRQFISPIRPLLLLSCFVAIFYASTTANAEQMKEQPSTKGLYALTTSGCQMWVPDYEARAKITWSGPCVDGRATGQGQATLELPEHSVGDERYEGGMLDGKMEGHGTYRLRNGGTLTADWQEGIPKGKVYFVRADGFRYEGAWSNSGPSGSGIGIWPSGARYEGEWNNGLEDGSGTMTYPSGAKYSGEFRSGVRAGHGAIQFPDGNRLEGEWVNDTPSGSVVYTESDGGRYEGTVRGPRKEGIGTFIWPNGDSFSGEWHDNVPDGPGTLRKGHDAPIAGVWRKGCLRIAGSTLALGVSRDSCSK